MPNHQHLIWQVNKLNGKESPPCSLLKFTAHAFQQKLRQEDPRLLSTFLVETANKRYEFWQRDSLAVPLFTRKVAMQKLHYLHNNPLAEHWRLVKDPCDYRYSSARYYERNEKDFSFLKHVCEEMS